MTTEHDTAAQNRNLPVVAESERESAVISFVREHPLAAVAAAAVVGVAVSSLLPKRAGSKLAARASQLVDVATVAGLALGRDAVRRAGETSDEVRKRGGDLADRAGVVGEAAYERAQRLGLLALDRLEELVTPATQAASSAGGRLAEAAQSVRKRIKG